MEFQKIKEEYNNARTLERNKISKFFREQKVFEMENPSARSGVKKYTSGGRFTEEYDLSNWKWVCVKRNNVHFFISLQTFERDPNTGNMHVLMDRIGIYCYVGNYSPVDAQTKMYATNIELPMNKDKLTELHSILKDLSECEIFKYQVQYEKVCETHNLV